MKKYFSFFRIRFINGLQYRAAAYAGIFTQFVWGFMELLLFSAFYRADPASFPMEFEAFVAYTWLQQAFLILFMMWSMDTEILYLISNGNIAYELCRPMNLYTMWMTKNMASRLSRAALRCMPILLVAYFLPKPYNLTLPSDPKTFLFFLVSMVLSFILVNSCCMFVYLLTFYTLSPMGVRIIFLSATEFLTGAIIPLPFLPEKVEVIFNLLPFASMQNLPLRIYSGDISGNEMLWGMLLQLFWVIVTVLIGSLWTDRVVKRAVVQGG